MLLTPKSKLLKEYGHKINPYISLPLYLTLTALIIMVQLFSISIAGLFYFFIALYIYWIKKFNFEDIHLRIVLIAVQVISSIVILLNYFVTINFVQTTSSMQ